MILLIDNYDSFTYNLAQFLGQLGAQLEVRRNDQITLDEIGDRIAAKAAAKRIEHMVISPGPGLPENAGVCVEVIRRFAGQVPLLGVCLGHQAIGQAFGGHVVRAPAIMHGKTSRIHHDKKTIFNRLPQDFVATRYHSLIVERKTLPKQFQVSAETDGIIMGLRNPKLRLEGVQFHPESVLTEVGMQLLRNFLSQ
jgi:para-aminobenzoate synthetase component 2